MSIYERIMEFRKKYPGGIAFRIKKHAEVVQKYIDSDEEILYAFCGQKNDSIKEIANTYAVVLTNKRILLGTKRIFWGSFFYTITPEMYNDMEIYRGLFWGKVTIDTVKEEVVLTNLPKSGLDEIETKISNFMREAKLKYKTKEKELEH